MIVLGIESSCDETSVAVLKRRGDRDKYEGADILSLKTHSQVKIHTVYGGVVPELAARSHVEVIKHITKLAIKEALVEWDDIDKICVTEKPGLIAGLLVGIEFAKGLGLAINKPVEFKNHLQGHIFTTAINDGISSDFFCLLVSGGHTQTIEVCDINNYKIVGQTINDSVGESFDKISKALGLGYPGGPIIENLATKGDKHFYKFGGSFHQTDRLNFSLSGVKTHFIRIVDKIDKTDEQGIANLCASFQHTISDILISRTEGMIKSSANQFKDIVICGGVAANQYIKSQFNKYFGSQFNIKIAPLNLCADNAAMIANLGFL